LQTCSIIFTSETALFLLFEHFTIKCVDQVTFKNIEFHRNWRVH